MQKNSTYKWIETDKSVALTNSGKVVWQYNYGKEISKPYFHPVSLVDGTVLTDDKPDDHPWHHGIWFTWKHINGVNFWEEDRSTGLSVGKTGWSDVKVVTKKNKSASITMDMTYNHRGKPVILTEKRFIKVSAPDAEGIYYIDWKSVFHAGSDVDVKFDRTPLPGEEDGKPWGGYAGLSVRASGDMKDIVATVDKDNVEKSSIKTGIKSIAMDYSGIVNGKHAGFAFLDSAENFNYPSSWYVTVGNMNYYSPAVIYERPYTVQAGKKLELKYRIIVHPGYWDTNKLKEKHKLFSK